MQATNPMTASVVTRMSSGAVSGKNMSQNESSAPSGPGAVLHVRHVLVVAEERPDPPRRQQQRRRCRRASRAHEPRRESIHDEHDDDAPTDDE